jgi:hypothetical protein
MPLWQDAARGPGAVAGRGVAATGLAGAGNGVWAEAAENSDAASVATTTRIPKELGIDITGL